MSSVNIKTSVAICLSLFPTLCAGITTNYTSLSAGAILAIVFGSLAVVLVCISCFLFVYCGICGRGASGGPAPVIQPTETTVNTYYPTQQPGRGMAYGYPVSTAPVYNSYTMVVTPTPSQPMPYQPVNTTAASPSTGVAPLATDSTPDPSSDPPPPYPDKY